MEAQAMRDTSGALVLTLPAGTAAEVKDLLKRVQGKKPSSADLAEYRALLRARPGMADAVGDVVNFAVTRLAQAMGNRLISEGVVAVFERKRAELTLPTDGAVKQALAEAAAVAWLRLYCVDLQYSQMWEEGGVSPEKGYFWERRLSSAQGQFLRACETLARVRRLLRPVVQVNVAEDGGQQVNVAGDVQFGRRPPETQR
jgi:hypothetical protein